MYWDREAEIVRDITFLSAFVKLLSNDTFKSEIRIFFTIFFEFLLLLYSIILWDLR